MSPAPRRALVLANGAPPTRTELDAAWPGWDADVDLVVAADGGARLAAPLDVQLDRWVGDGDSLAEDEIADLERAGVTIRRVSPRKDETDTELALLDALAEGAAAVTIVGALGGSRLEHELANLALLAHPALAGRPAVILGAGALRASLLVAPGPGGEPRMAELVGRAGDLVSLLPLFGDVDGITTEGLEYPLRDEALRVGPARGISNVRIETTARVTARIGRLLIVETPANLGR